MKKTCNSITYILGILLVLFVGCSNSNGLMRDFDDEIDDIPVDNGSNIQLIVGSYNLRLITTADVGVRSWDNRKQWVRKIVDDHGFDILGTQEGVKSQLDEIIQGKDYAYVAVGRDDGVNSGETSGILYKKSKFEVMRTGTFWLSLTPDRPSYGWDASIRRICTWVQFKELSSNKIFFFFNAHFDHQGLVARLESAKLTLQKIREIAGNNPCVLTGDLNANPTEDSIKEITSSNLLWDSRTVTTTPAEGPVGTFHSYDLVTVPTSIIDYVFVSKTIKVLGYKVVDDDITTGNIASDHMPVRVRIEL